MDLNEVVGAVASNFSNKRLRDGFQEVFKHKALVLASLTSYQWARWLVIRHPGMELDQSPTWPQVLLALEIR